MKKVKTFVAKKVCNMWNCMHGIAKEERGASELVVVIVLMVIVLVLAVAFKDVLAQVIQNVGNKVMNWINAN